MSESGTRAKVLQLGAALLFGCVLWTQPNQANATVFCDVVPTYAGVAPLRAAPSATARLVAPMHAGDEVQLRDDIGTKNGWVFVTWWKGGRFKLKRSAGYDPSNGEGWVRGSQLSNECG